MGLWGPILISFGLLEFPDIYKAIKVNHCLNILFCLFVQYGCLYPFLSVIFVWSSPSVLYISFVGIRMTKSRRYLNRGAIHMIIIHIIAYDASLKSHFSKRFSLKGPVLQVESCSIYV